MTKKNRCVPSGNPFEKLKEKLDKIDLGPTAGAFAKIAESITKKLIFESEVRKDES